jgi:hypothetical protein
MVYADGRRTRDQAYMADVVSAFPPAAGSQASGPIHVGTGPGKPNFGEDSD